MLVRLLQFLVLFLASNEVIAQTLPENINLDTAHFPFTFGVTSGDPTTDRVVIWTRIESNQTELVTWQLSQDSLFSSIDQTGNFTTDGQRDWTVKVDVDNLDAQTNYYYRFQSQAGQFSDIGRTKTAPIADYDHSRLAIMSCSSIYSGFFNAYQRIAERKDLDLIIHVGDYIYDFVDAEEQVRVPDPYPIDPITLGEWRERHRYYLMDPNLRAARKAHPWIVLWDNHDVDGQSGNEFAPIQAFLEYIPVRLPNPNDSSLIYRKIEYGSLMDIFVTDVLIYKNQDTLSDGTISMIGNAQYEWLTQNLAASTAKWKLLPMQNLMAGWSVQNVPSFVGIGQNGVLDPTNWDGYDTDRDRLLNFISSNNIDNVVVLSGDSHVSIIADLTTDPQNSSIYNSQTGGGSVAVEFLPTSITRGNFDEMGFGWAIGIVTPLMEVENPNHVFMNLVDHGYGLLDVKPDSCVAELWYSPILNVSNNEEFERGYIVKDGENHWIRNETTQPTLAISSEQVGETINHEFVLNVHPNPTRGLVSIQFKPSTEIKRIYIFDELGRQIEIKKVNSYGGQLNLDLKEMQLKSGLYVLCIESEKSIFKTKIILN
jgi:alkaline phosphatase D